MYWVVASVIGIFVAVAAYFWPIICSFGYLTVLMLFICALGVIVTVWVHVVLSSPHQTSTSLIEKVESELQDFREQLKYIQNEQQTPKNQQNHLPVIFGRTVDGLLQQLLDLIFRDFVLEWLKEYSYKADNVVDKFKIHLWGAIQDLHDRLSRVDVDKMIACDMITKVMLHFEKIRIAQSCANDSNHLPVFALSPHLMSAESELHYLRQTSELLIMFLLPRCYSLAPASHLLREVLACKILQPAIDLLTEPDYLNQKILSYLEAQKAVTAMQIKTHEYARSFEDFLRLINNCSDIDALKRIRYNIVSEIMQATTLQNVKRARGIDIDALEKSGPNSQSNLSKQQIVAAKKIKRYISQLTFAKSQCEDMLKKLGWEGAFPTHDSESPKTLPLSTVLESVTGRRHLSLFLETMCSQGLVGYWTAVEELRYSHRSNWHQLGAEIYYTYIRSPSAEIKVDKESRRRMEAFLLGDKGPEVFYEVQHMVVNTIQDKYYLSFLMSDHYKALLKALASEEHSRDSLTERSPLEERQLSSESVSSAESATGALHVGEHSTYARRKLDQLQERLNNKTQALAALRASLKPESRALGLLSAEVERLAGERRRLEAHLERTDTWAEHLGRWRATVNSAEIIDESRPPQFVIVVHMAEEPDAENKEKPEGITTGWVLLRTLTEFQDLHRKLRPMCADVKNLELPSNSFKFLFGKNDKNSIEKAKMQIQKYLEYILEDERLNQSEALYAFLSPSSEHLKHTTPLPKKPRFSFSTLFKSASNETTHRSSQERDYSLRESGDDDDILTSLDSENPDSKSISNSSKGVLGQFSGSDDSKDSIAEPLYAFMGEVFDMRGVFKWLRRTLITFVQITYGRTINRQIRDTITWLFSEQMLHYYISVVIKSWWPGGVLSKPMLDRVQTEKEETRILARQQFVNNVPEVLTSLVGTQTAQRGAQKVFDTLQNSKRNKQLFYEIVELLMIEVFPELKQHL